MPVDLKQQLVNQALKLMQDPRVAKAMQNPKLVQGMMSALQLRAKMQTNIESQVQKVAKSLNLATGAEVRELRRTVRRLERELEAHRLEQADGGARSAG